jgi:TolA-binding protein
VGEFASKSGEFKNAAVAYYASLQKAGKTELGEKAAHKLAWSYFRMDDFANARQTFSYQRGAWPNGPLAADAVFMEAECLFKQKKFEEAMAAYGQVKNPAGKDFQVLALLHAGQAAGQLKQWDKSLQWLDACVAQFPDSSSLPEALCEQGWAKQNLGKTDEALALYAKVIGKTNGEVAARAQFMIGEIQFQQKNHAEAVKSFFKVSYGYSYPQWQADATYQAGRCFEVLNNKEQAIKQYRELIEKYPQSDKTPLAKQRIAELQK